MGPASGSRQGERVQWATDGVRKSWPWRSRTWRVTCCRGKLALDGHSEQVGWLLASHAAVAFSSARSDENLHSALSTRQTIGTAMGILMERHRYPADQAFEILRTASQNPQRQAPRPRPARRRDRRGPRIRHGCARLLRPARADACRRALPSAGSPQGLAMAEATSSRIGMTPDRAVISKTLYGIPRGATAT